MPLVGFIAGAQAVAPVTTIVELTAGAGRGVVFRKGIEWSIVRWALPGALLGAGAGAALFSTAPAEWLQILVGLFLISTILQYRFGKRERTFKVRRWWFLPAEGLVGFLSGLIGATGPPMNSFYLNAGITKERLVGTKTAVSLPTHLVKLGTYMTLGALTGQLALFGLAAGAGALASNLVAKRLIDRMPEKRFRGIIVAVMAITGTAMIWQQRETLTDLF